MGKQLVKVELSFDKGKTWRTVEPYSFASTVVMRKTCNLVKRLAARAVIRSVFTS